MMEGDIHNYYRGVGGGTMGVFKWLFNSISALLKKVPMSVCINNICRDDV